MYFFWDPFENVNHHYNRKKILFLFNQFKNLSKKNFWSCCYFNWFLAILRFRTPNRLRPKLVKQIINCKKFVYLFILNLTSVKKILKYMFFVGIRYRKITVTHSCTLEKVKVPQSV